MLFYKIIFSPNNDDFKRRPQDFEVTEYSDEDSVIGRIVFEKRNMSIRVNSH